MQAILLRLDDTLAAAARVAAATRRQSLSAWLRHAAMGQVLREAQADPGGPVAAVLNQAEGLTSSSRQENQP